MFGRPKSEGLYDFSFSSLLRKPREIISTPDKTGKKKEVKEEKKEEKLGPTINNPNELVWGVVHIMGTKNDTFIHVTDLSGRETFFKM